MKEQRVTGALTTDKAMMHLLAIQYQGHRCRFHTQQPSTVTFHYVLQGLTSRPLACHSPAHEYSLFTRADHP
jgi:hypothetical protein